jgi:hypothetical protein
MALKWSIPSIMTARISTSGITYDTDAQAFFTATGITDATIKAAINQLVLDLKNAGLWTKIYALYPIVGGAASPHSYNLKNPSLYQITWAGSPTHSANGVQGNGTTQYGDTGISPASALSLNDTHISAYTRTAVSTSYWGLMGIDGDTDQQRRTRLVRKSTPEFYPEVNTGGTGVNLVNAATNAAGFYLTTRASSTTFIPYIGSTSLGNENFSSTALATRNIYILAVNSYNAGATTTLYYSGDQIAFASVGTNLTSTEEASFYTAIQNFQTTLGRQV